MTLRRIVLVAPRFWPWVGGQETIAAQLAVGLVAHGIEVTVFTAGRATWPPVIDYRGATVVRFGPFPHDTWSTLLSFVWLRRCLRGESFDAAVVFGLGHRAAATLLAAGGRPVVVQVHHCGPGGDVATARRTWLRRWLLRRVRRSVSFAASSAAVQQELLSAGVPATRIAQLGLGVAPMPPRRAATRQAARTALGCAQVAFELPGDTPLIAYCGQLAADRDLSGLVTAYARLTKRFPNVRLWMVGEGPQRLALQRQIEEANLTGRALLTGTFEDCADVWAAADVACFPAAANETGMALHEAMMAGLPIVAADSPLRRQWLTADEGLIVPPDDPTALNAALERVLVSGEWADTMGLAARRRAEREASLAQWVDRHVTWLRHIHDNDRPKGRR